MPTSSQLRDSENCSKIETASRAHGVSTVPASVSPRSFEGFTSRAMVLETSRVLAERCGAPRDGGKIFIFATLSCPLSTRSLHPYVWSFAQSGFATRRPNKIRPDIRLIIRRAIEMFTVPSPTFYRQLLVCRLIRHVVSSSYKRCLKYYSSC